MTVFQTTRIQAKWSNNGSFLLWADSHMRSNELIRLLFALHKPSYYGTFVHSELLGMREVVVLPADWAVDYWLRPPVNDYASIRWGDDANDVVRFARLAEVIRESLRREWFMPDYEKWREGSIGWRLILPESYRSELINERRVVEEDLLLAEEWLGSIIEGRVEQGRTDEDLGSLSEYSQAFARCRSAYSKQLDMVVTDWVDEDDWLQTLGWRQDPVPFRLALQLSEPNQEGESWKLTILALDKQQSDKFLTCSASGEVVSGTCPAEWRPLLAPRIQREVRKWLYLASELRDSDQPDQMIEALDDEQAWLFLMEWSPRLIQAGVTVLLPSWWERMRRARPVLKTRIRASAAVKRETILGLQQLMQFDWQVSLGGIELSREEYEQLLAEKKRFTSIRGQWVAVDQAMLINIQKKLQKLNKSGGIPLHEILKHELLHYSLANRETDDSIIMDDDSFMIDMDLSEELNRFLQQLLRIHKPTLIPVPRHFQGTLRRYQHEGLSWLVAMRNYGFGACLADDMGLGKTVQWIAYLLHVKETEPALMPSLLICPTSVLGNWQKEFQRFAPNLNVYLHHGPQRLRGSEFWKTAKASDVVITSYPLTHLDKDELSKWSWEAICLDEAQNIKNAHTKQAQAIKYLRAKHRVALTGTPLENRLSELWSIMNFINPGYLGPLSSFTRNTQAIEKTHDEDAIKHLQVLVKPFLLRRVKNDPSISLDLPKKEELKCYVSLTAEQSTLYEEQLDVLFGRIDRLATMERRGTVLSTIMKLKQLCDHPAMIHKDYGRSTDELLEQSNKLLRLTEMVEEVREAGERCLIFTQFVDMGKLLQAVLQSQLQERVLFMHGGISKKVRDGMIAEFQSEQQENPCGVFILSLKTGGTGLNLTAANHVFHYDRWWNPAVENQASDRVYRIGQDKNVFVHKFISIGTLEEKIDEMLERKLGLSRKIVGGGEQWIGELSTEELRNILELRNA